ncbi:hypothetical protein [Mucilaginibacter gynuensis]
MKAAYSTIIAFTLLLVTASFTSGVKTFSMVAPPVEGWFFRAVSGYPAAIRFEPVVLFKNGDFYEVSDEPIDQLNIAESKSKTPKVWGKWRKSGETYYLTNSKGQEHDYKLGNGNWFPAYPYTGAVKLKKGYQKVSGGDYGNGLNTLSIAKINFVDATHFTEGSNTGVSTPAAKAWNKTSAAGTYKVYNNTIELTFTDGKTVKKSFAFGASGRPAKATNTMIFIGGDAYTDTE